MCKIAIIPGITDETTENAWKLIKELSEEMSLSDDDGFGYAALDAEGNMFGERWFNPKDAFKTRDKNPPKEAEVEKTFKGFLKSAKKVSDKPMYNDFGNVHETSLRCAILHARKATCAKTMENLHPFVIGDFALIHNGVIHNTAELTQKVSTCDSECILNEYIKHDVVNNLKNVQKMVDKLDGYYACAVIGKQADGRKIIDVFRDSAAKLRGYYIKELNQVVFGTTGHSETYGPIPSACKDIHFTITEEFEIPNHKIVRMDAMTGEVLDSMDFDGTYKGKKKRGGGHGGNLTVYDGSGSVRENMRNIFGTKTDEHNNRHQSWSDKQKEEEIERMLVEGDVNFSGYEVLDKDGKTIPPIPNNLVPSYSDASKKKEVWEQDFEMDASGMWHKKAAVGK